MSPFLLQLSLDQAVAFPDHLPDESGVIIAGVEVPAAPEHQGLVDSVLEPVMSLLGNAVFMALAAVLSLRTTCGIQPNSQRADCTLLLSQCFPKGHQRRCCMGALVSGAGSALVNAAMFSWLNFSCCSSS